MRVTCVADGRDYDAFGPAIWGGYGEVYIVGGTRVEYHTFRAHYVPAPERRCADRRATDRGRRWRDKTWPKYEDRGRTDSRRVHCRRMRDRLTRQEIFQLARGIEHTVASAEYRDI